MKQATEKRGWFLTIMILFLIVGDLQIPYYLMNSDALHTIYRDVPAWYPIYALLGLISNIAIIIGMWQMKRWSIYILIGYFVSKIAVDAIYILPDKQLSVFATTIVGAAFWALAIYLKRKNFR